MSDTSPPKRPTLDEIRKWPATVSVEDAARALGVSRAGLYATIAQGAAPVEVIRHGERRIMVVTDSLIARLTSRATNRASRIAPDMA